MKLKIITPQKLILDQEVDSVTLPGVEGEMTILPLHAAMIAMLQKGKLRYRLGEKEFTGYEIESGLVEVLKDNVLVISKGAQVLGGDPSRH